jgi:hypothetical protein
MVRREHIGVFSAHASLGQLLLQAQQLTMANKPSTRDHNSVSDYIAVTKPLLEADASFIKHTEDLITLRPGRESAWVDDLVERLLKMLPYKLTQVSFALYLKCQTNALLTLTLLGSARILL